jgi:toxin ParE1/3/4
MAGLIWTEPALEDLGQIADYIALDDPNAAKRLVRRVFKKPSCFRSFRKCVQFRTIFPARDIAIWW